MPEYVTERRWSRFCQWVFCVVVAIVLALPGLAEARAPVLARSEMVAAANPYAAEAGLAMLRKGGSAVDAAIAVQLVLSLVEPQSSGIGGGAFMLYYAPGADGKPPVLTSYDGRETAPAADGPDLFAGVAPGYEGFLDAVAGGRSVGTPGVLAMLALAHERHGKLPWADLFAPAIHYAEAGFVISPRLHYLAEIDPLLRKFAPARAYLFTADGKAKAAGTVLKNPAYAATLKLIRDQGVKAFYHGPLAEAMVAAVQQSALNPGRLSAADLAAYAPVERAPVCASYRESRICGMAPPSSGGTTVLALLRLLERFDLHTLDPNSAAAVHLFVEASKLAYADRDLYVADPAYVAVPTAGLIDAKYLATRSALIDPRVAMVRAVAGTPPGAPALVEGVEPELPATSHFAIIDRSGVVVSMTTSVESAFGSRLMAGGFFLNNQLTDFAFEPESGGKPVANRVEAGKRPRSSMAPTLVFDRSGDFRIAIGSPGGGAIIDFVARTLTGMLDWGLDIQSAIELPQVINRNGPTTLEEGTAVAAAAAELRAMGHQVELRRITSGLHGIAIVGSGADRRIYGGADPRREGVALGH